MSYVVSHAFFRRTRVRNKGVTKHVHKVRVVTIVLSQILDQKIVLSQILDKKIVCHSKLRQARP